MAYKTALSAVFIEGFIFVFLAVTGVRTKIIRMIPKSVMLATSAGIGLYLAHIGLQQSEGLNIVTYDSATIVTLGESLVNVFHFSHVFTSIGVATCFCSHR